MIICHISSDSVDQIFQFYNASHDFQLELNCDHKSIKIYDTVAIKMSIWNFPKHNFKINSF